MSYTFDISKLRLENFSPEALPLPVTLVLIYVLFLWKFIHYSFCLRAICGILPSFFCSSTGIKLMKPHQVCLIQWILRIMIMKFLVSRLRKRKKQQQLNELYRRMMKFVALPWRVWCLPVLNNTAGKVLDGLDHVFSTSFGPYLSADVDWWEFSSLPQPREFINLTPSTKTVDQ